MATAPADEQTNSPTSRWLRSPYAPWVIVVLAMVVSLLLGAHDLAGRPLTEDETDGRSCASSSGLGLLCENGDQSLYYLASRAVVAVFGTGIGTIRMLSVLAGVATVPLVFSIGRRLSGTRAGLFACVLSAVSLPAVMWQQNARGYILGTFFATATAWAFLLWRDSDDRLAAYAYFVTIVLAVYALFFDALVVVAELMSLLWWRPPSITRRRLVAAVGPAALCCLPIGLLSLGSHATNAFAWVPRPGLSSLGPTGLALMSARSADGAPTSSPVADALGYASLAACLGVVVWAFVTVRRKGQTRRTAAVLFCALWLVVPPLAVFALSQGPLHLYVDRYFTICLPAAALLLGIVVDSIRPPIVATAALVGLAVLRFSVIPSTYGVPFDGTWEAAATYLTSLDRPGDCLTFSELQGPFTTGAATYLAYYSSHGTGNHRLPRPVLPGFSWRAADNATYSMPTTTSSFASVEAACRRLFVIIDLGYQPSGYLLVNSEMAWFKDRGWSEATARNWNEVRVVVMQPPS